ncbi:MAG TPA: (2Fe-2S)-binding protein [bacterium]|jgi:carbon-monoxide dehydrogenase small subunit|nr:(2Fe-2S)-binding protein [Myxococcales bacterium]OQA58714.1 MAG: Nicotinate dehydrogenase small FeS subunit [bacterium ADurb.Bin270]HPW45001.1 (2Fe-2S)-binding protein [bacterium]
MKLNVNGKIYSIDCDPDSSLLDVIREKLRLTGTKRGCDIGVCGTCTVLIDGETKRACKVKVSEVVIGKSATFTDSPKILTIEGLSDGDDLHPIQRAFIECGAVQCGFCTPGMILTAKALLDKNPKPIREEIRKSFTPNLCRCTGYQQIFEAVEMAAKLISK